jgi:integrase
MSRRQFGTARRLPSGRWQARYVGSDGMRRNAPVTFATKREASAWLAVREAEVMRGDWLNPDLGRLLFADFSERWVKERALGPRTRQEYARLLRLHLVPFLGGYELAQISTDTVRSWRAELVTAGRSDDMIAKAYRVLKAIMNTAVDDERIRRNPCRIKGADRVRRAERPIASVRQVYTLAELLPKRFRVFVLTAAFTGLRWGELIALRRRDLDLERGTIRVVRAVAELDGGRLVVVPTKSEAGERVVTLPDVLVRELRAHLAAFVDEPLDALVFTGERGGVPKRGSWRSTVRWTRLVVEVGLQPGFRFHDLRHTGNHLATQSGASTRELMERMGHSTMRAALIYQHATNGRAREIAESLNSLVLGETDS